MQARRVGAFVLLCRPAPCRLPLPRLSGQSLFLPLDTNVPRPVVVAPSMN